MKIIENESFAEERALYNLQDTQVLNCQFMGEKDGESVLKEARNIFVDKSLFSLRYPMWHVEKFTLKNSHIDELARAPIWYGKEGMIENTNISSIKAIRECENIIIKDCIIDSMEFGWKSNNLKIDNCIINSQYFLLDSKNVAIKDLQLSGKYSFQYMENLMIEDSCLDTKDAFWHSKNVVVKNSLVKGEYLGWFSNGLTLINCKIIGRQPLCYCKNLNLVDCEMLEADLAFEYSEVEATIKGKIESIKNPASGHIKVNTVGEIILKDSLRENNCIIEVLNDFKGD